MDINALFRSNYLKAADLQGQARRVSIASCQPEQLSQGEIKPVLKFAGVPKGLALNKTNSMMLAAAFGPETTGWTGREIELVSEMVMYQGKVMPGIRVRIAATAAPTPVAADPFAHATPAPAAPPPAPAAPPPQAPAAPPPEQAPTADPAPAAPQQQQAAPEQAVTPALGELPIAW